MTSGNPAPRTPEISFGRIVSFLTLTVIGGLLQLWIVCLLLLKDEKPIDIGLLLGTGGLYFFATSLVTSSFMALSGATGIKFGSTHFNVTLVLAAGVVSVAIVFYVAVASSGAVSSPLPFSSYKHSQLACAFGAFVYAFYARAVTGFFRARE